VIRVAHMLYESVPRGGVATVVGNLLKYMDRHEFKPLVIAAGSGQYAEMMAESGYEVRVLSRETGPMMNKILASKTRNPTSFASLYIQMRKDAKKVHKLLYEENIDILHTHHHHDHILGAMACGKDIRSIWQVHGIINPKSLYGLQWRIFNYYAYKYPSHIIAVSNAVRESMTTSVQEKTSVVYNGIKADKFPSCSVAESKQKLGFDPDTPLVGAVGRFVYIKGFHNFISMAEVVAAKHKDVGFVIIGSDDIPEEAEYRNECLQQIKQAHLEERFTITGLLADSASFMPALDVLVLPTVTWEGFGLVVLEAQASGKPVVSTDCGGPADIVVDGQTGYIVPRGDVEAMSEKVLRLLSDKELAITMGAAGRVRAAEPCFDVVNTVRKTEHIYIRSVKSSSVNV